jgi:hypothetical protein
MSKNKKSEAESKKNGELLLSLPFFITPFSSVSCHDVFHSENIGHGVTKVLTDF